MSGTSGGDSNVTQRTDYVDAAVAILGGPGGAPGGRPANGRPITTLGTGVDNAVLRISHFNDLRSPRPRPEVTSYDNATVGLGNG